MRFDIDSRKETTLTPVGPDKPGGAVSLAVSPDGAQVAYVGPNLVVAPAAGGPAREVVRFRGPSQNQEFNDGLGVAWSPDQRYLFFVSPVGANLEKSAIWRVPLTGGEAVNVGISMQGRFRALRVRPDGRQIAFDSVVDALSEIWALENFLPKVHVTK